MRHALGPRLFLKRREGCAPVWYIRDGYRMQSTGLAETETGAAEEALRAYAGGRQIGVSIPSLKRPETVYFVTCDVENFPIKIGVATNVQKRLESIQVSLPYKVVLLATAPGGLVRERKLHIGFNDSRMYGEWFKRSPELMATIEFYARRNQNA